LLLKRYYEITWKFQRKWNGKQRVTKTFKREGRKWNGQIKEKGHKNILKEKGRKEIIIYSTVQIVWVTSHYDNYVRHVLLERVIADVFPFIQRSPLTKIYGQELLIKQSGKCKEVQGVADGCCLVTQQTLYYW